MNVLTQIPWLITEEGTVTVERALKERLPLKQDVPGYVYGAQLRFLMTVFPLLVREAGGWERIDGSVIDAVLSRLAPQANLFDPVNPFLQLPERFGDRKTRREPGVLHPLKTRWAPRGFWNYESYVEGRLSLSESVLALVISYFYQPGGNMDVNGGKGDASSKYTKLNNGSSALRWRGERAVYPATEVVPIGTDLLHTLALSTPKDFLEGETLIPHWADREGLTVSHGVPSSLWRFSWSGNVIACQWSQDSSQKWMLQKVGIGGCPDDYVRSLGFFGKNWFKDKDTPGQRFHKARCESDPLYLYVTNKKGESTLPNFKISTSGPEAIIRWYNEGCVQKLKTKLQNHLASKTAGLLFLSHNTGGNAQTYYIENSACIPGKQEQWLPGNIDPEELDSYSGIVIKMHDTLINFFQKPTKNQKPYDMRGVLNYAIARQRDAETMYWNDCVDVVNRILSTEDTDSKEIVTIVKRSAEKAINWICPDADSAHVKQKIAAINEIWKIKYD